MADTTTDTQAHAGTHADHAVHPTEKQYWIVFVALAVFTAIEVALSYGGLEGVQLVAPLVVLMAVKFMLVAGAFMHLYFDLKILNGRLFTWAFGGGLVLAMGVYAVVFAAFRFQV
ncbi:MAG: cytochrome C oxidase subunit IV family protein [Acidimicrobiia bacterium]|nr:cytochrome C oxidase subunit IV family protein [Acidimicrobiia bacterium]